MIKSVFVFQFKDRIGWVSHAWFSDEGDSFAFMKEYEEEYPRDECRVEVVRIVLIDED